MTGREGKSRNGDNNTGGDIKLFRRADLPVVVEKRFFARLPPWRYYDMSNDYRQARGTKRKGVGTIVPDGSGVTRERLSHYPGEW